MTIRADRFLIGDTTHGAQRFDLFNTIEERRHIQMTWDRLKKFQCLTTGVESVDDLVKYLCGPWLTPSEEHTAIIREIHRAEAKKADTAALRERLAERLELGIVDPPPCTTSFYELVIRRIPFEKDDGERGMMKIRQVLLWTPPAADSGTYRVTFKKSKGTFTVIDVITGKRVNLYDMAEFRTFLTFFFDDQTINYMLEVLCR